MTETMTQDHGVTPDATIDIHLAAYCEPDRARRVELLTQVWSVDGTLIDPPYDGAGIEGIADMVDGVLAHFPAHRFERTQPVAFDVCAIESQ